MNQVIPVNQAVANLFLIQCIGVTSGHMVEVPNNPVIKSIIDAHGINTSEYLSSEVRLEFAKFLSGVVNELTKETRIIEDVWW